MSKAKGGAHGFTITKKHLTLYWDSHDRYGYYVELKQPMGAQNDSGPVNTPLGFYHLMRQVGTKQWGIYRADIDALIRAMGRRFNWSPYAIHGLLNHGHFSYCEKNGEGGTQYFPDVAWLDS